jgi:hypothetical protein
MSRKKWLCCFNFFYYLLRYIANKGAKFNGLEKIKKNYIYIYIYLNKNILKNNSEESTS